VTVAGSPQDWRYIASSVVGTSHLARDVPCQDSSRALSLGPDHVLLVASDGAGSASRSHIGSAITCDTFAELATTFVQDGGTAGTLDELVALAWIDQVVGRLRLQAEAEGVAPRELACTVMLAFVGPEQAAYIHLGDGGIVVRSGETYDPVVWPDAGEYANTTYFLTDDSAASRIGIRVGQAAPDEVAVFTDGLQMLALKFETKTAHGPFFSPMFRRLRAVDVGDAPRLAAQLADYLLSGPVSARTDDDKTLILATRVSAESVVLARSP
jgi:hypothetical protein